MTRAELEELARLLDKWIHQPDWDTGSDAWATLVEARRQVAIELSDLTAPR
jgi:hypothetical protein